ncbi:MAG: beta-galactosidase, partial [Clostridia bacterium]|nr:beta-galactosidase [Clostridia bacterium]
LFSQKDKNRIVEHLVYGIAKVRGDGVEVIEDLPYTGDVECSVKTDKKVKRVYLAPSGKELEFSQENGVVKYVVPSFSCAELAVIDFE